ncbi:hypothetical protein Tco_0553033 [Tanacetum coccineum]
MERSFLWVDDFARPALFPWHTAKNVTRDPAPVAADFNAQDYATLVARPSPFRKFLEEFMCLTWISLLLFILQDPTKVKVVERERIEDEPLLLETTVGLTVPLLPVAPDRAESELEASVDKLFDEGGSGNQMEQGDFAGGGQAANIQTSEEKENHGVGPFLLCHSLHLSFIISSDSSHHFGANVAEAEVDSLVRSSVPVMTAVTTVTSTVGPALVVKEKPVKPYLFSADSSLAGGADPNTGVFLDLSSSDFLVGGIRTVINPNTDLHKVYVPQWSVANGPRLDDGRICYEMVDEFAPPKFFAYVREMEHDQLFTEFNIRAARQISLSAEVRMRAEYNVKERQRLKSVVEKQDELLKVREGEIENLKAHLLLREAKAAEAIRLCAEASNFETVEKSLWDEATDLEALVLGKKRELTGLNAQLTSIKSQNDTLVDRVHELELSSSGLQEKVTVYENCMEQLEKFQDDRMKVINDKFDKLYTDFVEMALHLEDKFYPHLLTTISGRRWLLTHGMELAITKCLNLPEYLSALGAAIGKVIKKGMQDGLSAGITHGREGRVLTDVAAHNPSAKVDYIAALRRLQDVNFPLLGELKSSKDASIEVVMNILRLEEPLADKLGLEELQPNVNQLMVPIHHSPDKVVIGATALSLALDVSILTGTEGTSDVVPATADTTTALSMTLTSASTIAPISVDDYEVVGTDNQAGTDEHATPFPNVDDHPLVIC